MEQKTMILYNFILDNWINILSLLIALVSFISYLKAKKSKKPSFTINSNNIIQDFSSQLDDLSIKYKDNNISNLTITKIFFWNRGKMTIDKRDIAKANPVRIQTKNNVQVLDAKIIYTKNNANQISINLSEDNKEIVIDFDYLDNEEGCIIQIIHNGKNSRDIELCGTIKGVGKPQKVKESLILEVFLSSHSSYNSTLSSSFSMRKRRYFLSGAILLLTIVLLIVSFIKGDFSNTDVWISLGFFWVLIIYLNINKKIPDDYDISNCDYSANNEKNVV